MSDIKKLYVDAILFDMDGTLIDSTPGVLKAWERFCNDYSLGNYVEVSHATHGRRLYDTLKELCHISDEETLQNEIDRFEDLVIQGGPIQLPGVHNLLTQLLSEPQSASKWTIVTSATNKYAPRALERCGVPLPLCGYITSNDVSKGKPNPDPYLAGAQNCGVDATRCLVVEDAPSGLAAGQACGSKVLAVGTGIGCEAIVDSKVGFDYCVRDLTRVSVKAVEGQLEVTIDEAMI
ncbi:HAD superfamily protein [Pleurotus pulmonarius]